MIQQINLPSEKFQNPFLVGACVVLVSTQASTQRTKLFPMWTNLILCHGLICLCMYFYLFLSVQKKHPSEPCISSGNHI
jgi:hypothetical protein